MSKELFNIIIVIAGLAVLYFIALKLFNENRIPTFEGFVASTTDSIASTTVVATSSVVEMKTTTIYTSKGSVKAFIADTDELREKGLSGRSSLPDWIGMIFVFDKPGKYGFWMKDMNFPIDMIWIDGEKRIVGVTKNVLPSSYPYTFMPPKDILYVLEMKTGSVATFGLTTGTSVKFSF